MPEKLTREQNLNMRLNTARKQAEHSLLLALEAQKNVGSMNAAAVTQTVESLIELVAEMRIESVDHVEAKATALISDYRSALDMRESAARDLRGQIETVAERSVSTLSHYEFVSHIMSLTSGDLWTRATRDVKFPSFEDIE